MFRSGGLTVDLGRRVVTVDGREVKLTPKEYDLLRLLVIHGGKMVTHQQLWREAWGPTAVHETPYLRGYMGQLPQKIEPDPSQPRYFLTELGVGYSLGLREDG